MSETQKPEKRDFTPEEARAFWQDARAKAANGDCDFQEVFFPKDPDGKSFGNTEFSVDADFTDARFDGHADFTDAEFGGKATFGPTVWSRFKDDGTPSYTFPWNQPIATFVGEASFAGAKFGGDADFEHAQFSKDADFGHAQFSENADFGHAQFSKNANFTRTAFGGKTDFTNVNFDGKAKFSGTYLLGLQRVNGRIVAKIGQDPEDSTRFYGDTDFGHAQFSKDADFGHARFSENAGFGHAQFSKDADFGHARFSENADFGHAQFSKNANFTRTAFGGDVDLSHVKFTGNADFEYAMFHKSIRMEHATSHGVFAVDHPHGWWRSTRRPFARLGQGQDAYRMAKQSATDRGEYQQAGKYHYAEHSTRCTALWLAGWQQVWHPNAGNSWYGFKARWGRRIRGLGICLWTFAEMVFGRFLFAYGERVRGILAAAALVIFGWSFIYCHSGIVAGRTAEGVPILTHSFRDCLYFSVVTFTTLGYGDLQPVEGIRAWAATEALLGAFLMALFVVGMARKFTR